MKRINKNLLIRLVSSTALLLCSALVASAQSTKPDEYPKVEVFVGYSALGEANGRGISLAPNSSLPATYNAEAGFETSVMGNFKKWFGIKGDFSAHFNNESASGLLTFCNPGCTTATQDFQLKTRVYNFLAGPEFKARNSTRFTPFATCARRRCAHQRNFHDARSNLEFAFEKKRQQLCDGVGRRSRYSRLKASQLSRDDGLQPCFRSRPGQRQA